VPLDVLPRLAVRGGPVLDVIEFILDVRGPRNSILCNCNWDHLVILALSRQVEPISEEALCHESAWNSGCILGKIFLLDVLPLVLPQVLDLYDGVAGSQLIGGLVLASKLCVVP
jgi:hypothetical protein